MCGVVYVRGIEVCSVECIRDRDLHMRIGKYSRNNEGWFGIFWSSYLNVHCIYMLFVMYITNVMCYAIDLNLLLQATPTASNEHIFVYSQPLLEA